MDTDAADIDSVQSLAGALSEYASDYTPLEEIRDSLSGEDGKPCTKSALVLFSSTAGV